MIVCQSNRPAQVRARPPGRFICHGTSALRSAGPDPLGYVRENGPRLLASFDRGQRSRTGLRCLREVTAVWGRGAFGGDERQEVGRGQRLAVRCEQGAIRTDEHAPAGSRGAVVTHEQVRSKVANKTIRSCHTATIEHRFDSLPAQRADGVSPPRPLPRAPGTVARNKEHRSICCTRAVLSCGQAFRTSGRTLRG